MAATNIAQEITRITTAKADLKTAIEGKGVTVPSSTLLDGYADLVDQIQQGGTEEAPENDVNFYDYDGRRIASYTIAEAKALTALPTPPQHNGLTFQEWNWTLNDIATYDRQYIDVGANYTPTDGKTHLKVYVFSLTIGMQLRIAKGTLVIEWGDGNTTTQTHTGSNDFSFTHTYSELGVYDIVIGFTPSASDGYWGRNNVNNGSLWFGFNYIEMNCDIYFNTGTLSGVSYLQQTDFKISLPRTSFNITGVSNTFFRQINLPRNTEMVINGYNAFYISTTRMSFPPVVKTFNAVNMFASYYNERVIVPEWTDGTALGNIMTGYGYYQVVSIPNCTLPTLASGIYFQSSFLRELDIVEGWTPNQNMTFSNSNYWQANTMVKFFTRLGTTQTAITLTFGSTNLNKLTAEEKAIATAKGYTLA